MTTTILGRGSLVKELPTSLLEGSIEDMQIKLDRRDAYIETLTKEAKDNNDLLVKMNTRVVYLTTLLLSINESETTKAQWEELLMVLAMTVPDRKELNDRLKFADPVAVLKYLDDQDLK